MTNQVETIQIPSPRIYSLRGNIGWVKHLAVSPDGRYIVTAEHNARGSLCLVDAHTKTLISVTGVRDTNTRICILLFAPDGKLLVIGPKYDGIAWCEIKDKKIVFKNTLPFGDSDRLSDITAVTYSPDGTQLVTGNAAGSLTTRVRNGMIRSYHEMPSPRASIISVEYICNGKYILVVIDKDDGIVVWDPEKSWIVGETFILSDVPTSAAVSTKLNRVFAGTNIGSIYVWSYNEREPDIILSGHTDKIESLLVTKKENILISSSRDGMIKFWDIATSTCIRSIPIAAGGSPCEIELFGQDRYLVCRKHREQRPQTVMQMKQSAPIILDFGTPDLGRAHPLDEAFV